MEHIETVGIKALRDALSAYLRKVTLGVRVLVSDHGKVIAEIRAPGTMDHSGDNKAHPILRSWLDQGWLKTGADRKFNYPPSPVRAKSGTWRELLNADRGDR